MKLTELNFPWGPIKICTIFDLIPIVRRHMVPSVCEKIAVEKRNFYNNSPRRVDYGFNTADAVAQTSHILQLNPMKLVTELKKTTTKKYRQSKNNDLYQLLEELAYESAMQMGQPDYFFSIGKNKYALVTLEDLVLFTTEDFHQQLVCVRPERNFTVHAPNLKVKL